MRSFRSGIEKSFIQDDGTNNTPKGLYSIVPATNEVAAVGGGAGTNKGGLVDYAKALETEGKITNTNQSMPLRWLLNDTVRLKALQVLKFAVNGASQLYMGGMFADRPATITNSIQKNVKKGTGDTSKNHFISTAIPYLRPVAWRDSVASQHPRRGVLEGRKNGGPGD